MARSRTGVSVVSLFKLLALCGVTQKDICRHLGLEPPVVNHWARGLRPMPRRHLEKFEAFVWQQVRRVNDAHLDAIEAAGVPGGPLGNAAHEPLLFRPPPADAPPEVQRWWDWHVEVIKRLRAWETETNPDPVYRQVGDAIRQLGPYGLMDHDKLAEILSTPRRREILALAEQICTHVQELEAVDAVDPRPMAARLRSAIQARRPAATTSTPTAKAAARGRTTEA